MISRLVTGTGYFLAGLALINKPRLRRFVVVPLLINTLIFAGLIWFSVDRFGVLIDWLIPRLPDWLAWLTWLIWLVFGLMASIIVFFSFSVVANLIGAPFNGVLSEAVERHLTGESTGSAHRSGWLDIVHGVAGELGKLAYFLMWAVPLLLLGVVPIVNLLAPALWVVVGAWMLALEYIDYPLGNRGLGFPAVRKAMAGHRALGLGFGGAVMLATLIPVVNFLVMPAAVAGATAMRLQEAIAQP